MSVMPLYTYSNYIMKSYKDLPMGLFISNNNMFAELSDSTFSNLMSDENFVPDQLNFSLPYLLNGNAVEKGLFAKLSDSNLLNFIENKTSVAFLDTLSDTASLQCFNNICSSPPSSYLKANNLRQIQADMRGSQHSQL